MIIVLSLIALLLAIVFVAVRVSRGGPIALYFKAVASLAFCAFGLYGAYKSGLNIISVFMLLGLILGMLGDIVLDLKVMYKQQEELHLNAGMLSFGVGHLMYFMALTAYLNSSSLLVQSKLVSMLLIAFAIGLLLTTLIMTFAEPLLKLKFGKFTYQTALYTFALTFMTAYAFTASIFVNKLLILAVGLLLFLLSDLVLSNQYFGGKQDNKVLTTINHILYCLGQILIALTIFFI